MKHYTLIWERKVYEVVSHMNSSIVVRKVFIGEVFNLSRNRALDGSEIHVKDPSTIRVDNVTNHTFTTKLYPPRSDCNIRIDLLSNR